MSQFLHQHSSMTNFCFFFVISFRLLLSLYSSSYVFFRAALKVERNNSKVHEPQAKVELSGLKKREYMTSSRLISTACDLQGRSIHFEYIFFSLHKAKIMCSGHEKTKSTFTLLGTGCEGGLPNYRCFYSCWCFYLFCFVLFFFDTIILFLFICVYFLFRHQRMCSRATQMQLWCVLQQYQRFIQLHMQTWIHGKWTRM